MSPIFGQLCKQGIKGDAFTKAAAEKGLSESKQGLILFLCLHRLISTNQEYNLATADGRLNLHCFLLVKVFGKDVLRALLEEADRPGKTAMQLRSLYNLVLPNSFEECLFRSRLMLTSLTKVHSLAMEGQKRMITTVWNELNRWPEETPVPSFCLVKKDRWVAHRVTPSCDPGPKLSSELIQLSKAYFSRTSEGVSSTFHCCTQGIKGITKTLRDIIHAESKEHAEDNTNVQAKQCNTYMAEIVYEAAAKFVSMTNVVVVPHQSDGRSTEVIVKSWLGEKGAKKVKVRPAIMEKDVQGQTSLMQRQFMEAWISLAKDAAKNRKINEFLRPWEAECKSLVKSFAWNQGKALSKQIFSKATGTTAEKTVENIVKWSERGAAGRLEERKKWHYAVAANYENDPLVNSCTAAWPQPDPNHVDPKDVTNINSFTYTLAFFLTNSKFVHNQTNGAQKFSEMWSDMVVQLGHIAFSKAVYSKATLRAYISFLENNGIKGDHQLRGYREGGYTHEIYPHAAPISQVSSKNRLSSKRFFQFHVQVHLRQNKVTSSEKLPVSLSFFNQM